MSFIKYSQRLLNPFRGSMNIIEFGGAEAVTLDGRHWDIYVNNRALLHDLPDNRRIQTSDIRYGSWSAQKGLKRGAIYPSDDFKKMEAEGAQLYEYLLQHHEDIPFPFLDNYELWLLDKHNNPLALIDSARREWDMDKQPLLDWRAGNLCCQEFRSGAYDQLRGKLHSDLSAGQYLTHYINHLSGAPPRAQWFKRTMDGHGIGLKGHHISDELYGRELKEQAFHPFMINDQLHDNLHINLINEFIQWQSPWLLLLDTLSDSQRMIFEEKSRGRALMVDRLYQLYPEILDSSFINAARVEATLRKSNAKPEEKENILCCEYMELHPSPYE